ncbi:MAG: MFS transporter [Sporichthyaceae bacterium]
MAVAAMPAIEAEQRRVLRVLAIAQAFGGVAVGLGFAVASLEAARLSGSDVIGGAAFTSASIGAAVSAWALARVADRLGRRPSLALGHALGGLGTGTCALAVGIQAWPLLLAGLAVFGAGMAAGMASRFAATDLAPADRRGRALSVVLWATTVGAVLGPNLAVLARRGAGALGLPTASGPFLGCTVAFAVATAVVTLALRPDPLLRARALAAPPAVVAGPRRSSAGAVLGVPAARLALGGLAVFQLLMVGVMSMSPVHLGHGGHGVAVVGLVISVHIAGMYALSPLFGYLTDRHGPGSILAAAATLMVVAGVVCGSAGRDQPALLGVGLVLLGTGWSCGLIAGSVLLTESLAIADRARAQGLSDVVMNVSGAAGGVAAGVIVEGGGFGTLGICAASLATTYFLLVLGGRRRMGALASGQTRM